MRSASPSRPESAWRWTCESWRRVGIAAGTDAATPAGVLRCTDGERDLRDRPGAEQPGEMAGRSAVLREADAAAVRVDRHTAAGPHVRRPADADECTGHGHRVTGVVGGRDHGGEAAGVSVLPVMSDRRRLMTNPQPAWTRRLTWKPSSRR